MLRSDTFYLFGHGLTLAAWFFGAIILGAGNAQFAVTDSTLDVASLPTSSIFIDVSNKSSEHCHDNTGQAHHQVLIGALPAHCVFCLDGLAASETPTPQVGVSLVTASGITVQVGKAPLSRNDIQTPLPRGPPLSCPHRSA